MTMFKVLFFCFGVCAVAAAPFLFSYFVSWLYYRYRRQMIPIPDETQEYKDKNVLKRLFVDFPRRVALDKLQTDPNTFPIYGMHLVCGCQGSGKTTLVAYLVRKYKKMYPKCKVVSNFSCKMQDAELKDWRQLTLDTNGIYGEIDCIDEIQNWFSSNASKDFPPDMLTLITQQRKVRRCIIATSQIFTRVAKPIRENTYLMYYPFTIMGAMTFVRVYAPVLDEKGDLKERKLRKVFFFVHDEELRDMFDSYKTIATLTQSGFKPASDQLRSDPAPLRVTVDQLADKK